MKSQGSPFYDSPLLHLLLKADGFSGAVFSKLHLEEEIM